MAINQGWPIKMKTAKYNVRVWLQLDCKWSQMGWESATEQSWIPSLNGCVCFPLVHKLRHHLIQRHKSKPKLWYVQGISPSHYWNKFSGSLGSVSPVWVVYIKTIGTFVAAFILKQSWSQSCDLKKAETRVEMKQARGVLPHSGPVDTYWGGVTCLDVGEGGRREGEESGSSS